MSATNNYTLEVKVQEDFSIKNEAYPKGSTLCLENYRGTQYWNIISANSKVLEVTDYELRERIFEPCKVIVNVPGTGEDFFVELRRNRFLMKPNRDISKAFHKVFYTLEDHKSYLHKVAELSIEFQPIRITWSETDRYESISGWGADLGEFKNVYSVVLNSEMLEAMGTLLPQYTLLLRVSELDDRYRFCLHYNEILGNRWQVFENYKGELWNQ